jgi:hypothetical protein
MLSKGSVPIIACPKRFRCVSTYIVRAEILAAQPSNLKESSVMHNDKEKKFGPFTVTAKFPDVTLTIDAEQKGSQIVFRKKIEGQCMEVETFDACVARLSKLFITYGDLTF